MPPEDLLIGETRISTLTATITDACPQGNDQDAIFRFKVTTQHQALHQWALRVEVDGPPNPIIQEEDPVVCSGEPSGDCYVHVRPGVLPGPIPSERYSRIPIGMYIGEVRALTISIDDKDEVITECDDFGSITYPAQFCDDYRLSWSVEPLPGQQSSYTGNGSFESFGTNSGATPSDVTGAQTVLFRATTEGLCRIRIDVATSGGGDGLVIHKEFIIAKRPVRFVDFSEAFRIPIYQDGLFVVPGTAIPAYYGAVPSQIGVSPEIEYADQDGNGVATDAQEHNHPLAYVRGTTPYIKILMLASDTALFPCMPGSHVIGFDSALGVGYLGVPHWLVHVLVPHALGAIDLNTFGTLPDNVNKYSHNIVWEVIHHPYGPPAVYESQHRIYTTLRAPLPIDVTPEPTVLSPGSASVLNESIYQYWESAFDISCRNANLAQTESHVVDRMFAGFAARLVKCKYSDGFNKPDDQPLRYWAESSQASDSIPADLDEMLLQDNGSWSRHGRCGSIAQLLRLCMGVHGIVGEFQAMTVHYSPRTAVQPTDPPGTGINGWKLDAHNRQQAKAILIRDVESRAYNPPAIAGHWNGGWVAVPVPLTAVAGGVDLTRGQPIRCIDPSQHADAVGGAQWTGHANWRDSIGVAALGPVANPRYSFDGHNVINHGGEIFDPSYGVRDNVGVLNYVQANWAGWRTDDLAIAGSTEYLCFDFYATADHWVAVPLIFPNN